MDQKDNELIPELEGVNLENARAEDQLEETLDLDEILREFSESADRNPVEQLAELEAENPVLEPPVSSLEDTREFDLSRELTEESADSGDTMPFEPVEDREETVEEMNLKDQQRLEELQKEQDKEEPFSDQWEPEYEQPMGEYVPAPPIIAHPRSRLKELKRKLIEGPEKRYYALKELGFGKLYLAIFLCLLLVLVSVGISILSAVGLVPESRQKLLVFAQLFLMLCSALLGSFQLIEGITDLLKGRFSLYTLLVITFAVCCVDAAFCLQTLRVPCCAAFSLQMLMALWSTSQKRSAEMGMMDTMRKATQLNKLAAREDYYNGKTGFLRDDGQVDDFMDHYNDPADPELFQGISALIGLILSILLGILGFFRYDLQTAIQILAVSLLVCAPAAAFISVSRPLAVLEKRLHKLGTVLCGWRGVKGLKKKAVLPIDHRDLFPTGTVKMNGVKFFGTRDTDEIIAYAAALVSANGGGLAPLFEQVLQSRNGHHYQVENFRGYDGGGIGGEVCCEPVLVGLLPFLRDMGVEIPEGLRVDQAVCISIDGDLCGIFALTYDRSESVVSALRAVCTCLGVKPVLTNTDFMLTKSFLRTKLGIKPKKLIIPEHDSCKELHESKLDADAPALLLTTRDGLLPVTYGISGARALHTAGWMGAILQLIGGLLGLAVVAVLVLKNGTAMLTPDNMFLFQLVWLIPAFLISEWTRSI